LSIGKLFSKNILEGGHLGRNPLMGCYQKTDLKNNNTIIYDVFVGQRYISSGMHVKIPEKKSKSVV
jgi:hypothetical protein